MAKATTKARPALKRKTSDKGIPSRKRSKQGRAEQNEPDDQAQPLPGGAALRIPFEIQIEILKCMAATIHEEQGNGDAKQYWRTEIFEYEFHPSQQARDSFKSVALTSKHWLAAAQTFLFHQVSMLVFDEFTRSSLEGLLQSRPDLARLVKRLDLRVMPNMTSDWDTPHSLSRSRTSLLGKLKRQGLSADQRQEVLEAWKTYLVTPLCINGQGASLVPNTRRILALVRTHLKNLRWFTVDDIATSELKIHPRLQTLVDRYQITEAGCLSAHARYKLILPTNKIAISTALRKDLVHELCGLQYTAMELTPPSAPGMRSDSYSFLRTHMGDNSVRIGPSDFSMFNNIQYLRIETPSNYHYDKAWDDYSTSNNIVVPVGLRGSGLSPWSASNILFWARMLKSLNNLKTLHIYVQPLFGSFVRLLLVVWIAPRIKHLVVTKGSLSAADIFALVQIPTLEFLGLYGTFPRRSHENPYYEYGYSYSWTGILRTFKDLQQEQDHQISCELSLQLHHDYIHRPIRGWKDPVMDDWASRVLLANHDAVDALMVEGNRLAKRIRKQNLLARRMPKIAETVECRVQMATPSEVSDD